MRRPRVSIVGMMGLILFIALALGALRGATLFWASLMFTLTVAVFCAAMTWAILRRGTARRFWTGFAMFGWVYLLMTFGPWPNGNGVSTPPFLTRLPMDVALPGNSVRPDYVTFDEPQGGERIVARYDGGIRAAPIAMRTAERAKSAWASIDWKLLLEVRPPPNPATQGVRPPQMISLHQFRRIGHCLGALAFGLLGGLVGLRASREEALPDTTRTYAPRA